MQPWGLPPSKHTKTDPLQVAPKTASALSTHYASNGLQRVVFSRAFPVCHACCCGRLRWDAVVVDSRVLSCVWRRSHTLDRMATGYDRRHHIQRSSTLSASSPSTPIITIIDHREHALQATGGVGPGRVPPSWLIPRIGGTETQQHRNCVQKGAACCERWDGSSRGSEIRRPELRHRAVQSTVQSTVQSEVQSEVQSAVQSAPGGAAPPHNWGGGKV